MKLNFQAKLSRNFRLQVPAGYNTGEHPTFCLTHGAGGVTMMRLAESENFAEIMRENTGKCGNYAEIMWSLFKANILGKKIDPKDKKIEEEKQPPLFS